MKRKSETLRKWQLLAPYLHRKQRTIWAAAEAQVIGSKGCHILANVTGISVKTLMKWIERLEQTENARAGSLIPTNGCIGAGRKLTEVRTQRLSSHFKKCSRKKLRVTQWGLKNGYAAVCET
jgi:hypothetical protein